MSNEIVYASRKRLWLAIYIDYLLFGALWEVFWHFAGPKEASFLLKLLSFSVLESALLWRFGSPGHHFLSIRDAEGHGPARGPRYSPLKSTLLVDPFIYYGETWLTMLLGIIFILGGSKEFSRWTMWMPPIPYFGFQTSTVSSAILSMLFGGLSVFIGYNILKLKRAGFYLTIVTAIAYGASIVLSWNLWDDFVSLMVTQRRAFQGLPIREGEIEFAQAILPEAFIVYLVLVLFLLFVIRKRLR